MVGFIQCRVWRATNLCGIFHGLQLQSREQANLSRRCEWITQLHPIPSQKAACFLNIDLSSQPTEVWKRLLNWAAETPEAPRQSLPLKKKNSRNISCERHFFSVASVAQAHERVCIYLTFVFWAPIGGRVSRKWQLQTCLPGSSSTSLWRTMRSPWLGTGPQHNNNSRQPQLASAYAFGCGTEHFVWIIEISIASPLPLTLFYRRGNGDFRKCPSGPRNSN